MKAGTSPYRLAVREEGSTVNAYLAPVHTMEGAQLLASVAVDVAYGGPEIRQTLLMFFQVLMAEALRVRRGVNVSGFNDPTTPPEHEKAGHA